MSERDRDLLDDDESSQAGPVAPPLPTNPITRRRLALVVLGIFVLWLIGIFAHQVTEAQDAQNQADLLRARNTALQRDVKSLERELALVKQPAFVAEMARGYLLGTPGEVPFKVDPSAPAPGADAPGSQGIVPVSTEQPKTPLQAWLDALFGSGSKR
jgi:cell division protein FtsB